MRGIVPGLAKNGTRGRLSRMKIPSSLNALLGHLVDLGLDSERMKNHASVPPERAKTPCGACGAKDVRLYRDTGLFFRPERVRCTVCALADGGLKGRGPCVFDSDGTVWAISCIPDAALERWKSLPTVVSSRPMEHFAVLTPALKVKPTVTARLRRGLSVLSKNLNAPFIDAVVASLDAATTDPVGEEWRIIEINSTPGRVTQLAVGDVVTVEPTDIVTLDSGDIVAPLDRLSRS